MVASRIVPLLAIFGLALTAAINWARGKDDQTIEGVAVQDNLRYEFFPGAKGCGPKGTSYLLLPNARFHELVREEASVDHIEDLFHSTWRVKLSGNISRIGRYGDAGRNLRELSVRYVIDARQLNCGDKSPEQRGGAEH
ncbi:MAG TPA: hypothetical protein VFM21_12140 [Terriglobia bacterium]|nr:hypothetical protein [Terriglobia bacterium]